MSDSRPTDLSGFVADCERWLSDRLPPADATGEPDSDVAVFHSLSHEAEAALIRAAADWQAEKFAAGYGALTWPKELGGSGLSPQHERAFAAVEKRYAVPADHELRRITTNLVAPTLRDHGSALLQERYLRCFLGCRALVCQLFSEPGAGSDLASVATQARRVGDGWVINGSKVWVSGAQFADYGLLLTRSDPRQPKHLGITAFLLPMATTGVSVRPIRQMSGGTSFNEVFLDDVELDDEMRIGDVDGGWTVALAMLTYERNQSGSKTGVGGSWDQLRDLALSRPHMMDPVTRDCLVQAYIGEQLRDVTRRRAEAARQRGETPGPEGSLGKLLWATSLATIGRVASMLAGPDLVAEADGSGPYFWNAHVLGAPGFRIAGGSDEIQRNIIGDRILGLPKEPDPYRTAAWSDLPR
ncbi:acyl-CoA dehydrogenase family protein [Streptomyces sp. NPDC001984]|uniref:acyl-CoA dehydrogenase family protein n=1 Tax=Streptomyces sp. NPDC002619 TaxID=3364655 RepID=UPI0036C8A4F9